MLFSSPEGTIYIVYYHTNVHVHIEKMGNLSKSKIKLYICDNKLRSCAQFAPRGKSAPGCRFALGCIFVKHRLHDQNTPQVQIYTPGVYLQRGVYCAYERGFSLSSWCLVIVVWLFLAVP